MLVYVSLCVCLLSQFHGSVNSSDNLGKNRQIHDVSNADHFRVLRSTFGILPAAVRTILEAAHEVATRSNKYRKFVKTGTPRSARRDFEALKPVITKDQVTMTCMRAWMSLTWTTELGAFQRMKKNPNRLTIGERLQDHWSSGNWILFILQRFALHGVVDDFNVRLKYADRSQGNNPSIYVFDQNGGNGVKIVYQTLDNELKELLSESSGL